MYVYYAIQLQKVYGTTNCEEMKICEEDVPVYFKVLCSRSTGEQAIPSGWPALFSGKVRKSRNKLCSSAA
jgi:hypothetical protein